MTKDEIIEMARRAGMMTRVLYLGRNLELLEAFAKLVAEKERESCALIELHGLTKRNLFAEITEGFDALTAARKGTRMIEDDDDIQDYKKPWIGLTRDEQSFVYDTLKNSTSREDSFWVDFANAIGQALKEKNT